jgi:hypothetical protein
VIVNNNHNHVDVINIIIVLIVVVAIIITSNLYTHMLQIMDVFEEKKASEDPTKIANYRPHEISESALVKALVIPQDRFVSRYVSRYLK